MPGSEETNRIFVIDYDNELKPEVSKAHIENLGGEVGKDFRAWQRADKKAGENVKSLTVKAQEDVLKRLTAFYDAVMDGFERARHGHNDWMGKVQKVSDEIEDDIDLSKWRT